MSASDKVEKTERLEPGANREAESSRTALSEHSAELMRETPKMPGGSGDDGAADQAVYPKGAELLPPKSPHKDSQPTAIVLDDFNSATEVEFKNGEGLSHGELSSRIAELNGFNVDRIQIGSLKRGFKDLPGGLEQINTAIDSGQIQLTDKNVVNVSLGVNLSFDEAGKMLGMELTPENLKSKREDIYKAAQDKLDSPDSDASTRGYLKQMLECTEQIHKLQERGIEVVAAGGNDGPDQFNFAMIAADKHYGATTRDGDVAHYSANNSMTEFGRGDVDFFSIPVNVLDPKPISEQTGTYRLDGSNARLPADEVGGFLEFTPLNVKNAEAVKTMTSKDSVAESGELIPAGTDTIVTGSEAVSMQGTSFVNVFNLPNEIQRSDEK